MTRRWVKQELKKNPIENIVIYIVNYYTENKNNVFVGIVVVIVICLFIGVSIKNRIKETRQASKLFAFAQNDFDRFNYSAAIKKFNDIEKKFRSTSIIPQVLYFKGLSYYRQGNLQQAEDALKKCINEFKRNKILLEVRLSLAMVFEDMKKYDQAVAQYNMVDDNEYVKPEALTGAARMYEIMGKREEAMDAYTKLQAHYVNTYWGNFAKDRLSALGVKPKLSEEFLPEIDLE